MELEENEERGAFFLVYRPTGTFPEEKKHSARFYNFLTRKPLWRGQIWPDVKEKSTTQSESRF